MAEAIVSGILEQLTSFTTGKASEAWELVSGVEKEVERLERNFKAIQYELEDAEVKQYQDKRVKHWLQRFKDVSYDMEDLLDDWKTASQELEKADDGVETSTVSVRKKRKVWRPFDSFFSFGSRVVKSHDIATRIKGIKEELDQIVKDKDKFDLVKREVTKQPRLPETTSFVDVSKIIGRDMVKEDIIRKLLVGEEQERRLSPIPTITIIGMGGLGKTALAQLIYNDPRIQTHFGKTIWVCVSDPFDLGQIARSILAQLDSKVSLQNTTPLQALFSQIHENIKEKKFLLVLDDVWIDHGQEWEQLTATFQSVMLGSRILVTTRKGSVAKHIESSYELHLDLLPDEVCWLILSQRAFSGRDMIRFDLEDIGREIALKCKGLPLAANFLGGLLQGKSQREEWQNVLTSEIWKLNLAEQHIFRPLLLSYYDLSSAVKQCLLYCAMFPKDSTIFRDDLICHWIAQGYLNSDDPFGTGEQFFKCLATHSFFQDFDKDDNGDIVSCKMHDIVHDFVLFLSDQCGFVTEPMDGNLALNLSSKKARHLNLLTGKKGFSYLPSVLGTEKLRSFVAYCLPVNVKSEESRGALQKLFRLSNYLRFFKLKAFRGDSKTVRDIGNLIHLRHLGLTFCRGIKFLPESVCEMPNLQSLDLRCCCDLEKLPVGIGKLINLRYLCTEGCFSLSYYPKGICNLTCLRRLSRIKVRADCDDADQFSFGDLQHLNLLGGQVIVEVIGNTVDLNQVKRAKLCDKKHLKQMKIYTKSPHINKEEVVQALNPPSNLRVELLNENYAVRLSRTEELIVPKALIASLVSVSEEPARTHQSGL